MCVDAVISGSERALVEVTLSGEVSFFSCLVCDLPVAHVHVLFQVVTNHKNTLSGFRNMVGRKFSDPFTQNELKHANYKVAATTDDGIGIQVGVGWLQSLCQFLLYPPFFIVVQSNLS